jgi:hypothetical protein
MTSSWYVVWLSGLKCCFLLLFLLDILLYGVYGLSRLELFPAHQVTSNKPNLRETRPDIAHVFSL